MARFANTIDNQPIYAARAEADKNGDRIDTTYAKLTDIPDVPVQDVEVDGTSVVNAQGVAEITMPTVPTATSELTNDSGFITASDVPAAQTQSDWEESDSSDPSYIQNKPDLSIYAQSANLATVATTGDYGDLLNTPTIPAAQVQSDWTEADSTSKAYIQHKPDLSVYAQSSSLATVATTGDYDDLTNKPSIPAAQVNSDWNAASGVAAILNKPNLATVATSGNYNDLSNLPTIPPAVTVDQHYDALSSNPQSGTAVAEAIAGTGQVPTVTSSDDSKVLMASYSGGQGSYSWQPTAAATQVNSDWTATSGVAEILHKPDLSVYAETADLATVATTGSYNDLSDKPSIPAAQVNADWNAVSGVAQILNKPTIPAAQVQSNWSEADSTSKAYIQNKPDLSVYAQSSSLATVATTGDYDDLVDAPTIVGLAAGANVTITEANNTVTIAATDTTYTAGTGISISGGAISNSDPIPSHTSTQSGKVLGVDSNGDLDWVTPAASQVQANWNESDSSSPAFIQNKPTIPTVDQFFNPASTNAQSGTAVAGALSNISQVPPTSQASAGDVLTVDQYGDATWVTPSAQAQVQADWTESDPTEVSYIQHKPNQKPLVAGQNIVLTEGANNVTIDCTASGGGSTYTAGNGISISAQDVISVDTSVVATQTDLAGKQNTLTAGSNVSIVNNVISATDTTYTAGNGISIDQNNEISVAYDSNTLNTVASTVTITAAGIPENYDPYMHITDAGFTSLLNGQTAANVTVHIPSGFFSNSPYFSLGYTAYLALYTGDPRDRVQSAVAVYTDAPLSYQYDSLNDEYVIDEQDVILSLPASGADWWPGTSLNFTDPYIVIVIAAEPGMGDPAPVTDIAAESSTCTITYTSVGSQALTVKNPLPASTVSDANKVLKVNASGSPEWATGGGGSQVQADWTEADSSDPAYIQNKPTPKTLTAGQGISIVDGVNTLTISANVTVPVQDVTVDGTSVVSNGVAAITSPTVDQTYDSSSTNAQSGVAVADAIGNLPTNLTSAQILSLKEALGVDETVLFENASGIGTGTQLVLSEAYTNFEKLQFVYKTWTDDTIDIDTFGSDASIFTLVSGWTSSTLYALFITTYTATDTTHLDVTKCGFNNVTGGAWTTTNPNYRLYKVVGIRRIASN